MTAPEAALTHIYGKLELQICKSFENMGPEVEAFKDHQQIMNIILHLNLVLQTVFTQKLVTKLTIFVSLLFSTSTLRM